MSLWVCATCQTLLSYRIPLVCPKCGAVLELAAIGPDGAGCSATWITTASTAGKQS